VIEGPPSGTCTAELADYTRRCHPTGLFSVTYRYDERTYGSGNRTEMHDDTGLTARRYEARGRVVTETQSTGLLGTYTTYDHNGQDQAVAMAYHDQEVVTATYNVMGLPKTATGSLGDTCVTVAGYRPEGRLEQLDLGDGHRVRRTYDTAPEPECSRLWRHRVACR
jgi:hypothetical protein